MSNTVCPNGHIHPEGLTCQQCKRDLERRLKAVKRKPVNTLRAFHFYASSIGEWKVSENVEDLISHMKRSGLTFALWKVPLPKDAEYQIRTYAPAVEGRVYLGTFHLVGKKWQQTYTEAA